MKKPSAAELIALSGLDDLQSLAIIGLSKNAGKTTSLNHLIRAWVREKKNRSLALTSVGRDGEAEDIVSGICKPRIYLPRGHLLATSAASLQRCDALMDIRELSGIRSALGEIIIGRTLSDGFVELSGPSHVAELKLCEKLLRTEEPDCLFIVDGALSRRSPAGGGITEAIVLAVSYGHSASAHVLLERVKHAVSLLTLPSVNKTDKQFISQAIGNHPGLRAAALDENNKLRILEAKTLLGDAKCIHDFYHVSDRLLFFRGAITETLISELFKLTNLQQLQLVVEDGSRLFIGKSTAKRLESAGVELKVLHPLSLRLVFFNPRMEDGSPVNNPGILDQLRQAVTVPVFDLGPALT
ncbi:MAG TPA: hypothetical protein VFC89_02845 [Oscillospiraceae bacterium]|nr:hypothetical protein [Oscillospiraceae bacterium]